MTPIYVYAGLTLLILLLIIVLARPGRTPQRAEEEGPAAVVPGEWDVRWLDLAKQIFDSTDYFWLRDELGFPRLAQSLLNSRRRMAIHWLKTVRASFNELARTPDLPAPEGQIDNAPGSWQISWLTVRFHLLLNYALLVVWLFGPYHRLIPALNWRRLLPEQPLRSARLHSVSSQNL